MWRVARWAHRAGALARDGLWWATIGPYCLGSDLPRLGGATERPLRLAEEPDQYPVTELLGRLLWFRGRLRLARAPLLMVRGLLFCLAILLAGRLTQVLTGQPMSAWAILAMFLVAGWSLHLALHHQITPFEVARFVDRRIGLNAQIATAVEFTLANRLDRPLARTQVRLATNRLRDLDPGHAIPMVWPGRDARLVGSVVVLYAAVGLWGSVGFNVPRPLQPIDQDLNKQILQQAQAPSPFVTMDAAQLPVQLAAATLPTSQVGKAPSSQQVQTLNQELAQQQISPDQYRADLQQLQQQLQAQAQQSLAAQGALNALAAALKDSSSTRGISDSLNQGDYAGASSQLDQLGQQLGQLSPQARQELAERLGQAGQQTQKLNSDISRDASQASQAMRQGDNAQASQALQSLGQSVQKAGQQIAGQSQLGQSLQDVQQQLGNQGQSAQNGQSSSSQSSADQSGSQSPGASDQAGQNGAQAATSADSQSASGQAGAQSDSGASASTGAADSGAAGASESAGQGQPGASAANGQNGGSSSAQGQSQQNSTGGGAGSSPGGSPLGGLTSSLDNHGVKLTIVGQPSGPGNPSTQVGDRNQPLTSATDSTINGMPSGSAPPSNVPINVHQESNVVPPDMKPIVRDYFSNAGS